MSRLVNPDIGTTDSEISIVRYYSSGILLRIRTPFEELWTEEYSHGYGYLGIWDPKDVFRSPPIAVIPPFKKGREKYFEETTLIIIPAEGLEKEYGQPVYMGDPIQLVDNHGRIFGKIDRFPFYNHVGVDNQSDPLIISFNSIPSSNRSVENKRKYSNLKKHCSLVEVHNGDMVEIKGIYLVQKKNFLGGSLVVRDVSDSQLNLDTSMLKCEIILKESSLNVQVESRQSRMKSASKFFGVDRTATGEFVGSLHQGFLYKRMEITKKWKSRYFVLTHLMLHWFSSADVEEGKKLGPSRGQIPLTDIKNVNYEQFSSPHNIDLELVSGKTIYLHSTSSVCCSKWANVLQTALEYPYWIHTEGGCTTIWRSDKHFASSKCPVIGKISLANNDSALVRTQNESGNPTGLSEIRVIRQNPDWDESIPLGSISYSSTVIIHLINPDSIVEISLEELNQAILQPVWKRLDYLPWKEDDIDAVVARIKYRSKVCVEPASPSSKTRKSMISSSAISFTVSSPLFLSISCGLVSSAFIKFFIWGFSYILFVYSFLIILFLAYCFSYKLYPSSTQRLTRVHWEISIIAIELKPKNCNDKELSVNNVHNGFDDEVDLQEVDASTEASTDSTDEKHPKYLNSPMYWETDSLMKANLEIDRRIALERWKTTYEFRMENGLDSILGIPPLSFFSIKQFFSHRFIGRDKQGHRCLLVELRNVDWYALYTRGVEQADILRHFLFTWEYLWSCADPLNSSSQLVLIVDCSNISFGRGLSLMRTIVAVTTKHYPERLVKLIVMNLQNWFAKAEWSLLKSSLTHTGRDICTEIGSSELSICMDANSIPIECGGTMEYEHVDELDITSFVMEKISTAVISNVSTITNEEISEVITAVKSLVNSDESTKSRSNYDFSINFMSISGVNAVCGYYNFNHHTTEHIFEYLYDPYKRKLWDEQLLEYCVLDTLSDQEDTVLSVKNSLFDSSIISIPMRRTYKRNKDGSSFSIVTKFNLSDIEIHYTDKRSISFRKGQNTSAEGNSNNTTTTIYAAIYIENISNQGCRVYLCEPDASRKNLSKDFTGENKQKIAKKFQELEAFLKNL